MLFNCRWQFFACYIHPCFRGESTDVVLTLKDDPTVIYTAGELEMRRIIHQHPDMANKVFSMGIEAAARAQSTPPQV